MFMHMDGFTLSSGLNSPSGASPNPPLLKREQLEDSLLQEFERARVIYKSDINDLDARAQYKKALHRLEDFILHGKVPPEWQAPSIS